MAKNKKYNSNSSQLSFQSLFESCPGLYLVLLPNSPQFTKIALPDIPSGDYWAEESPTFQVKEHGHCYLWTPGLVKRSENSI